MSGPFGAGDGLSTGPRHMCRRPAPPRHVGLRAKTGGTKRRETTPATQID